MTYTIKYNKALLKYEDKQRFVEITASSKNKGVAVVVYTFDEWKTTRNKTGSVVSSKDNDFLYRISIPINIVANVKMWFSVKLIMNITNNTTKEIWDNNNGWNYEIFTEKLPKICLPSPTKPVSPAKISSPPPKPNPPTKSRSPSPPISNIPPPALPTKVNNPILSTNFKATQFTTQGANKNILVVKVEKSTESCTNYNNYFNTNYINNTPIYEKLQDNLFSTTKINTLYNNENNFPLIKFSRGGYSIPAIMDTRKPIIMNKEIRAA